ncbi:Transmembrane osmosensor [Yamadazyma tenuis]|uniref:High osmolarity signaling protein SHO1 n=1 Tax=Candida tenuis (strain ATCC 10573 / BCRC 21748 / CBS 615 / JCM 9827 / NBRC 10315 / NRRL Y-1498 / VKM Y-70) TaxID=590646 RepID=G3B121_CANTC|nr:uncharacterized protein CANTEDRAFT_113625 [Yamadazyma tenuis ATCC 10573]XP_006685959.1 uncharacterized protein CANTEDRAFT_113625 [Yamadazyma tenuis ATCC 10573]EGV65152.1 hypothetical protein CANTEDRAFT_113625 [Yamadazyma tenuis ATCC 10573]EGV65153.1 hypothetical protein CANTEDRAFT_113625 [Yamadazyma tenuis ATCC 10573]WEJ97656.1 Transmembrane osmosensor [Yamadazyma tenuis]
MPFKISGFLADPFAISTLSFGVITWIVAIAGAASSDQSKFPRFTWWGLVYQILLIIAILFLYLFNIIELYKFTLVGLLSIAFVYTSNSTNNLIYNSTSSANLCCAAGCMLLAMLNLTLIIYFGGHPESPTNQFIDSFSLKPSHHNHLDDKNFNAHNLDDDNEEEFKRYANPSQDAGHFQDNNLRQSQLTTNNKSSNTPYMSSSQLNGLENFSSSDINNRDLTSNQKRSTIYNNEQADSQPVMNFRYKAKALYSYDANPDDINEISFVKDEILEVDDIDGKWWQAKKANGQIGICPSNYVKLLD